MTKNQLIDEVTKKTGFARYNVATVIDSTFESIKEAVANNDKVKIHNFVSFQLRFKKGRVCQDISRRKPIQVPDRMVPHVDVSKTWFNSIK